MVTCPTVHRASATVGQLREFFRDSHVHAAVLVEHGTLVGVVEPQDLTPKLGDEVPARRVAKLDGRTIRPGASADDALVAMTRDDRRRLAVVGRHGRLLGLLCLKASGYGFCSDADVASRRCAHAASG
jgi:CBS-domain-containing membrane protein